MSAGTPRRAVFAAAAVGGLLALHAEARAETGLERYLWKNRLVVALNVDLDADAVRAQRARKAAREAEWRDRRLLLVEVDTQGAVRVNGAIDSALNGEHIRAAFDVPADRFTTLLIGLDGTEKRRAAKAIANEALLPLIDAMPMRRRELETR